jgi:hypothetical protein
VVLERLGRERSIESYDDLYAKFKAAGYELDFDTFMEDCYAESDLVRDEFVRGITDALELDQGETMAFALAILFGRPPEE